MKKLKIKIALLGLVAFLAIGQSTHIEALANDVLLSYQLIASANAEQDGSTQVDCYAIISDAYFVGELYRRCNAIVDCSDPFLGKNPQDKSQCTPSN
jgi:hypothetical protein